MSLVERRIDIKIALDGDTFDGSNNALTLRGLRSTCQIKSYSGTAGTFASQLQMRINGMYGQDMAKLSTLGYTSGLYKRNLVSIFAGDDVNGMTQVFSGGITYGNVDYNSMPDVGVDIIASALANMQFDSIAASSYQGSMNVATMLEGIARSAGLGFQNNGVTAKLSNHAVSGTANDQIRDICNAAGVIPYIENGKLYIWPAGSTRDDTVVEIGPSNGLVGYPRYIVGGVEVTTLFNPEIQIGRRVKINSSIPPPSKNSPTNMGIPLPGASGTFYAWSIDHDLSAQVPGGPWFSTIKLGANAFNAR